MASDAATMPLHWIYDQKVIEEKLAEGASPSFFDPPSCPYYKHPAGVFSPYGDESLPLLRSMGSNGGNFDKDHVAVSYHGFFPGHGEKGDKGYEAYLNHVPKEFVKNRDEGKAWAECAADDSQAHGISKMHILAARYAGQPELLTKVDECVRLLQISELSVAASRLLARILERSILTGEAPAAAMQHVALVPTLAALEKSMVDFALSDERINEWVTLGAILNSQPKAADDPYQGMRVQGLLLTETITLGSVAAALKATYPDKDVEMVANIAKEMATTAPAEKLCASHSQVLAAIGLTCSLPSALLGPLYLVRKCATYVEAVHANIIAGGDSCSRAICVGALYGAAGGEMPPGWEAKIDSKLVEEVKSATLKIVQGNAALK
jgi:hypothetical protein